MKAEVDAVDVDVRILIDALEQKLNVMLLLLPSRNHEVLPIPADPADGVARRTLAGAIDLVKRTDHRGHVGERRARHSRIRRRPVKQRRVSRRRAVRGRRVREILNAPIVRKVELAPRAVIKRWRGRTVRVAEKEQPIIVKRDFRSLLPSRHKIGPGMRGGRVDGQRTNRHRTRVKRLTTSHTPTRARTPELISVSGCQRPPVIDMTRHGHFLSLGSTQLYNERCPCPRAVRMVTLTETNSQAAQPKTTASGNVNRRRSRRESEDLG